ncbi:hypothetical protein TNCV_4713281 [Trichonephila clavipes]|nr:hypothetical protein TNCV_4713281 [Trichonephila clavipes]
MAQLNHLETRSLSPIQNCTPPTSTTSNQLFLLLITGLRLNALAVLFPSMQQAGTNCSNSFPEWSPPNYDFLRMETKFFRLVLGVLPARHLQNTFLNA